MLRLPSHLQHLSFSEKPLRKVSYAGAFHSLGKLEAFYLDLLWKNRGRLILNEWAYTLLWPDVDRLDLVDGQRLSGLARTISAKIPGVIHMQYSMGRWIPEGSGITLQRVGTAREFYLFVKVLPTRGVAQPVDWD